MSHLSDPASRLIAVTPSDATDLTGTRGLYVGTSGDLIIKDMNGTQTTIANAPVGYHPLRVTRVMAATTATDIVALS